MTELWSAVKDRSLRTSDRLKVACYLWKQECSVGDARRRSHLLRWASEEVCSAHSKKTRSPPPIDVCSKLWQLLAVMLERLRTVKGLEVDTENVCFNVHFFQAMMEVFSLREGGGEEDHQLECSEQALKCLHLLLHGSSLPPVLHKFETTAALLESLLKFAVQCPAGRLLPSLLRPLNSLLKYYIYLQGIHGNQKKVFTVMCTRLLHPTIAVRERVMGLCRDGEEEAKNVLGHLEMVIQTLFSRDHLPEFSSSVMAQSDSSPHKHKRTAVSYTRTLFETLEQLVTSHEQTTLYGIPLVYGAFLQQNSKEQKVQRNVEFKFFLKILHLLRWNELISAQESGQDVAMETEDVVTMETEDDHIPDHILRSISRSYLLNVKYPPTPGCLDDKVVLASVLNSLSQCLELLTSYNVYQAAEDHASGGEQFSVLKSVTAGVMKEVKTENISAVFKCLAAMLKLNHKLVEPWLHLIWLVVFTGGRELSRETEQLSRDCVSTYSKLRQLPLLIRMMFESLDLLNEVIPSLPHPLSSSPSSSLTLPVEALLGSHLASLPPGQSIELLELLNKHLLDVYWGHRNHGDEMDDTGGVLSRRETFYEVTVMERVVDLAGVVLSYIPSSTWVGREREKAMLLSKTLAQDVCVPLLGEAQTSGFSHEVISSSLNLVTVCCELVTRIRVECPQAELKLDWPVKLVWSESSHCPVPEQWDNLTSCSQLGEKGLYLMKKLSVLHLMFDGGCEVSPSNLLDFILEMKSHHHGNTPWSGQLLSIDHLTLNTARLSLILSHLPFLYEHCTSEHLSAVAGGVVTTLVEGGGVRVCGGDGVRVYDVIECFLESEGFTEMKELQELIVKKCIASASSALRKILPKPLKKALKLCTKEDSTPDSLSTSLLSALHYGLDSLAEKEKQDGGMCLTQDHLHSLLQTFKVLRCVPLDSLSGGLLLRILVAVATWHVATVTCVMSSPDALPDIPLTFQTLEQLATLLAFFTLSLTMEDSNTKKKKNKKKMAAAQRESGERLCPVLDLLLQWLYGEMRGIASLHVEGQGDLEVSNLVAMEIIISARMKLGGYPHEITSLVSGDVMSEDLLTSAISEQWLYTITNVTIKTYQSTSAELGHSELSSSLSHLCEVTLKALEVRVREREKTHHHPLSVCQRHPVLVSTLAALLHCKGRVDGDDGRKQARVLKLVSRLCGNEKSREVPECDGNGGENPFINYKMVCSLVDLISLSAILGPSRSCGNEEEAKEDIDEQTKESCDQTSMSCDQPPKLCDLSIVYSWKRLYHIIGSFFEHLTSVAEALHILGYSGARESSKGHTAWSIRDALSSKFSKAMALLLKAASKEEAGDIFDDLLKQDTTSVPSVCAFCYSWQAVLDCKLSQEGRGELRTRLQKVMFACQSIACEHLSNMMAVIAAIHLSSRLMAIPSQVGLDPGSVMSSLLYSKFTSPSKTHPVYLSAVLLDVTVEMMLAVLRQHSHFSKSSPVPVITITNNLLEATLKQDQLLVEREWEETLEMERCEALQTIIHCANQLTRIFDMMSHQKAFVRFALYTVYKYIKGSHNQPLHPEVKAAVLPGVYSMLKLCSSKDIAFIKATVTTEERDSLQTLIDEHQKFYKFGGRV